MLDVILDTILDSIKLIPFLFVAFLFIELIEHKMNDKIKNIITKRGKLGPLIGSIVGLIPQCGMSVLATNLYITRIITLGTLISIYLVTSDEMLPVLLSEKADSKTILFILAIKLISGILAGTFIDFIIKKKEVEPSSLCEEEHCDCNHHSIISSAIIHTLKSLIFIFIITLILNSMFSFITEEQITKLFMKNSYISIFISPIIGMMPSCASSIMLTELYLKKAILLSTCIAGLLPGSGVALSLLLKSNKDKLENIKIMITIYMIGVIVGSILYLIGL